MATILYNTLLKIKILLLHLHLSVTSANFYSDVYRLYKGYGLKYLFIILFISSTTYSTFLIYDINKLKNYFQHKNPSENTSLIDYIIRQIPNISYDGNGISINQQDEPFIYLHNKYGNKIAIIDPQNKAPYADKVKLPIIFSNNKIIISWLNVDDKRTNFTVGYPTIFGNDTKHLTQENIKEHLGVLLNRTSQLFVYFSIPILLIMQLVSVMLNRSITMIVLYLLTNFFGLSTTIKQAMRLTLLSSGVVILVQPVIINTMPQIIDIIWLLQIWINLLVFLGLTKVKKGLV